MSDSHGTHPKPFRRRHRVRRAIAAYVVGTVAVGAAMIAGVLAERSLGSDDMLTAAIIGLVSGTAGALTAIVLMPAIRRVSGRTAEARLLEAANPAHPLMRRLMIDAPGTYAHSVAVANLAETAAEEIGGNSLLARVGAYYHDVGKISSACWFFENQDPGDNPHDTISPDRSVAVITAHVRDGERIGREYHLPVEVDDIIRQHHGTTLVQYFYNRAASVEPGVFEGDYRYQGEKPRTKEAALVMIGDACEAAVRAMMTEDPDVIEGIVRRVIEERVEDGQLSDSGLTNDDLERVASIYTSMLASMHHGRCEYPEALRKVPGGDQHHQPSPA